MILKDTILSAFTDRLTLMKWLKKVEQALKESVLADIQVNQTDAQHMTMTFVFEGGAQIESPVITLPKGEQGPQGATTKVSVGNTYTVDSNTPAMVQDVQSGDDVVLEFTIPRGERGPQGPKGDPGDGATGIDQLKNFVWPIAGTVTAGADANGVSYVGSASLKVGSGAAEENFEVPGLLQIPLVGSDTIVIDATEDGKKVEIHLDAAIVAKLQKALTLPTETPSSFSLIGVGTNGAQRNATLGEGLGINSGNQIHVQAGAGLQIDSTDKTVAVNPGGGLTIDGGQLAVNVGSGLSISSSGALQATGGGSGGGEKMLFLNIIGNDSYPSVRVYFDREATGDPDFSLSVASGEELICLTGFSQYVYMAGYFDVTTSFENAKVGRVTPINASVEYTSQQHFTTRFKLTDIGQIAYFQVQCTSPFVSEVV